MSGDMIGKTWSAPLMCSFGSLVLDNFERGVELSDEIYHVLDEVSDKTPDDMENKLVMRLGLAPCTCQVLPDRPQSVAPLQQRNSAQTPNPSTDITPVKPIYPFHSRLSLYPRTSPCFLLSPRPG